jgi:hypothetical protein
VTEDSCTMHKEEYPITGYMCDMYRCSLFMRKEPILSSGRMLHKGYNHKGSVAKKKISGLEHQGARRQDGLTGGKLPFVK